MTAQHGDPHARHVAAGGPKRAIVGVVIGLAAGAAAALVMPREEGPRRRLRAADRPQPRGHGD